MTVEVAILSSSGRRQATVALMIATTMQAFDSTIANVALPQLQQSLGGGIDLGSGAWRHYHRPRIVALDLRPQLAPRSDRNGGAGASPGDLGIEPRNTHRRPRDSAAGYRRGIASTVSRTQHRPDMASLARNNG